MWSNTQLVSYLDYYQPEAYVAVLIYIEKDPPSMRKSISYASRQRSPLSRRDVIIIASVSTIYGLGSPTYQRPCKSGCDVIPRDELTRFGGSI